MRVLNLIQTNVVLALALACTLTERGLAHEGLHDRVELATREIAEHPDEAKLFVARAELHRQSGSWAPAFEDLEQASRLANEGTELELVRGRLLFDLRWYASARKALDRFLERRPAHATAHRIHARALEALADYRAAEEAWTRVIALSKTASPEMYVARAKCISKLGRNSIAEALGSLSEGFEKLGSIVSLQLCALELEVVGERFGAALVRIDGLLSRADRKDAWLAKKGDVLSAAGRHVEARRAYEKSLRTISKLLPKRRQAKATLARMAYLRTRLSELSHSK